MSNVQEEILAEIKLTNHLLRVIASQLQPPGSGLKYYLPVDGGPTVRPGTTDYIMPPRS